MFGRITRALLLTVALTASTLVAAQPAQAASGGGCSGADPVSVCISLRGSTLFADFYMNANAPDPGRKYGVLWIESNRTGTSGSRTFTITTKGARYGDVLHAAFTVPPSPYGYSAVAKVQLYTHQWVPHGLSSSPRLYY